MLNRIPEYTGRLFLMKMILSLIHQLIQKVQSFLCMLQNTEKDAMIISASLDTYKKDVNVSCSLPDIIPAFVDAEYTLT